MSSVPAPAPIASWLEAARIYREKRVLAILFMGFSSGLPLALTAAGGTLGIWLTEAGVTLTAIGFFALVSVSYNVKFIWSPIIDRMPIPILTKWLGRRRSWAVTIQIVLAVAILGLGASDPAIDPHRTALAAVVVAFLSASQDIVIDAYRVELLKDAEQGAGAAATQFGYRVGMLASGAGALYLASFFGWQTAYVVMAALMSVGVITVLMTPEPAEAGANTENAGVGPAPNRDGFMHWLRRAVIEPFADFILRPHWAHILVFVILYKLGDALAGVVLGKFYIAIGFSKVEIASVTKVFGLAATILGLFLGGAITYRLGIMRALMVCGVLQMLSILAFAMQAIVGHDVAFLMATIAIENVTWAMGSAAFVAYLSALCNVAYTATQYALLSSLAAVPRTILASGGGWLAERMDWVGFFLFATAAALPGLILLAWLMHATPAETTAKARTLAAE